jgi:hypothetical protein
VLDSNLEMLAVNFEVLCVFADIGLGQATRAVRSPQPTVPVTEWGARFTPMPCHDVAEGQEQ